MKKRFFIAILFLLTTAVLTACGSLRSTTPQVVPQVSHDTIYLTNHHYDSVFIDRTHTIYRARDTVRVDNQTIEHRYRLLRDTIRLTRIDSIPVIREVEVVREVRHTPWYTRLFAWVGVVFIALLILKIVLRYIYERKLF